VIRLLSSESFDWGKLPELLLVLKPPNDEVFELPLLNGEFEFPSPSPVEVPLPNNDEVPLPNPVEVPLPSPVEGLLPNNVFKLSIPMGAVFGGVPLEKSPFDAGDCLARIFPKRDFPADGSPPKPVTGWPGLGAVLSILDLFLSMEGVLKCDGEGPVVTTTGACGV
jgi:hypothetical protein